MEKTKLSEKKTRSASALILAVVLTSLLAIIGTVFLMVARVDKIATSAITENKELQFALESVVAEISQQLALDVPHNDPNQEYYDYPDPCNAFLAALEPYQSGGSYYWRQVSDVTGYIKEILVFSPNDVPARIVGEHDRIDLNTLSDSLADADGDGVSDSIWIELNENMTTSKGKPIYAAVRIIDNGGMINVNTAYKFDPNEVIQRIDGSSQMQINLMALAGRPGSPPTVSEEAALIAARVGSADPARYEENVIWRYGQTNGPYTPFDISDELELRYRFLLNHTGIDTRLEAWGGEFRNSWVNSTPFRDKDEWFISAFDVGGLDPNYAYRHIATTYNMDRIINPDGPILNYGKMLNVNRIDPNNNADPNIFDLYNFIQMGFADTNFFDDSIAAQLAVNIKDFRDSDAIVSSLDSNGLMHYGFERPCVYISELAHRFVREPQSKDLHRSYAIELYKPYESDDYPTGQWQLVIENYLGSPVQIAWSGTKHFHVILFEDPCAPINVVWEYDPNFDPSCQREPNLAPNTTVFDPLSEIKLQRPVGPNWITVDSRVVPAPAPVGNWFATDGDVHSFQRDITLHKCIRRLWDVDFIEDTNTLGSFNSFVDVDTYKIQAHPENQPFTGIGDIAKVFRVDANGIMPAHTEADVRLNLADPPYQHIFNYLTVMDPAEYISDANETRIKGRININTAPWFVIAQLPWMTPDVAQAVVSHRDTPGVDGFESIGELMLVNKMGYYGFDSNDLDVFPDLTSNDGAIDDFEERDVIFSRISNLVTVRSDVFTAYILVRIGVDGPQKRAIAILDRSQVNDVSGKVKLIALHPVPDPR